MFGKKKPPREGATASGVVLQAEYHEVSGLSGGTHEGNSYRVTVRVTFDDRSTAEMSQQLKRDEVGRLYEGDTVPIRYDPTDRSRLEIDQPALAARTAEWKADIADLKARQDREGDSSNPKADLIRLSIVKAKHKGDAAEVQRLSAMLADLDRGGASEPPAQ
jgi:hypothetical protein